MSQAGKPILIAGATASGKSALAVELARALDGVVINADSMQVYRELPILTAQPSAGERDGIAHELFGHIPAEDAYSVARYIADAAAVIERCRIAGKRAIIVGGTGLYFKALLEGLSPVPEIPADVRERWRQRAREIEPPQLHEVLAARDPEMASRLNPNDRQRVTRALEVLDATGQSLAAWQRVSGQPTLNLESCIALVVDRPREALWARCDQRFEQMMAAGALDEVARLLALKLAPTLPAMGAIGVSGLGKFLRGAISRDEAIAMGKLETRQYVKRQQTWMKRNMIAWKRFNEQQMENINSLVRCFVDLP